MIKEGEIVLLGRIEMCEANSEDIVCSVFGLMEVVKREVRKKDLVSPVWNGKKLRPERATLFR